MFWYMLIRAGRPITAALSSFFFGNLQSIQQFQYLRATSVIGIGLLGFTLYRILRCIGKKKYTAMFGSILLCLTPSIQLVAGWTICFVFPYAIILASYACFSINNIKNRILSWLFPSFILLLAFLIYQPAAMYYWVLACIFLITDYQNDLSEDIQQVFIKFLNYLIRWIFPTALGYLVVRTGNYFFPGPDRSGLISIDQIAIKLYWFIKEPLSRALNIFSIKNVPIVACCIEAIIIIGLFFYLRGSFSKRVLLIFLLLWIILISYLPNLVINECLPSYRSQIALSGLVVVLFLFALKGIMQWSSQKWLNGFLLIMTIVCSLAASRNVINNIAIPQEIELRYLKSQLISHPLKDVSEIDIIQVDYNALVPTIIDEFGRPSTNTDWAPEPMIRLILMDKQPQFANIPIKILPPDTELSELLSNPDTLIIDMRKISEFQ